MLREQHLLKTQNSHMPHSWRLPHGSRWRMVSAVHKEIWEVGDTYWGFFAEEHASDDAGESAKQQEHQRRKWMQQLLRQRPQRLLLPNFPPLTTHLILQQRILDHSLVRLITWCPTYQPRTLEAHDTRSECIKERLIKICDTQSQRLEPAW